MKRLYVWVAIATWMMCPQDAVPCTGIMLSTEDGSTITARTIEWAGGDLNSRYVIVPAGYAQQSWLPGGARDGCRFEARYGYVGLAVEEDPFVVEGVNEAGLSAGLFYFPEYGEYPEYDASQNDKTLGDLQLVSWVLSGFRSVDEVKQALQDVRVTAIDPSSSTVHWRITEQNGRQIVVEIVAGKLQCYDNPLGVLTNSPGFEWHQTNLNNYVNLVPGTMSDRLVGDLTLRAFGGGSGLHGIPGDMTPPSRFVRAAFFQTTAPRQENGEAAVLQAFHILNNFDIPVGIQFAEGQTVPDIPSATQWTVATDLQNRRIYFRTMYNSNIRCIDLKAIDFKKVHFQSAMLDAVHKQPIEMVRVK